ncbi:MAG: 3-phosphoserine/phosphohydroxythreonine transaminase, partial [Granulosicoccaceae bacterium]
SALIWNLLGDKQSVDYAITGMWSRKAQMLGSKLCNARVLCDAESLDYRRGHDSSAWDIDPNAAFVHYCPNETVHGIEFPGVPDTGDVPLVADYSSSILSEPLDVSRFGVIYGGAQKNMGPAGITLIICRRDLLQDCGPAVPPVMSYKAQEATDSMLNTPPTYSWYLVGLVLQWLKEQGGLSAMQARNKQKASTLYQRIDASNFYNNLVDPAWRSRMNVVFNLADPALEPVFVAEADAAGLQALKGHKAVGGIRASLYNAVEQEAVDALVDFMGDFEQRHG